MARTGTQFAKITGDYSNANVYGTWQLRSTDTTNKQFNIRLRAYLTISGSATFSSTTSTFKLDNTTVKSGSYSYTKGDHLLGYKDITVDANSDGSFLDTDISIYAKSFHFPATTKTATLTSKDVPKMEIGSSIIDIQDSFSDPDVGVVEAVTMNVDLLEGYTTILKSTINGTTYTLLDNVTEPQITVYFDEWVYDNNKDGDNSDSVLYPLSDVQICELIPNDRTINITFTLETYENSELKGTSKKDYIFTITNGSFSAQPLLESDSVTTSLTGDTKKFISNFSTITVDSNVTQSNNGATVKEYIYTRTFGDSVSTIKSSNSTYTFDSPQLNDMFRVNVIDSRGFEVQLGSIAIDNQEYSLLDYFLPQFSNLIISRPEQTAPYVEINLNGSFWNGNFGIEENILTLECRYKLSNESEFKDWIRLTPVINDNNFSYNGTVENISSDLSAIFEIRIIDITGSTDSRTNISIPKGKSMFDWGEEYFNWNGELCINNEEVPCFKEDSAKEDGSRNVTLYDHEGNKVYPQTRKTVYNETGDATNVATATNKTIASLTVPAGTYIVNAHVNFASNSTGVRKIYIGTTEDSYANTRAISDTRPASNHQATMSNISTILAVEEQTTYYLNVYQNSGSTLSCSGSLRALRNGDYQEYQNGL